MINDNEMRHVRTVVERVLAQSLDVTSDYNDWLKIAFSLASMGEDGREFFHQLSSLSPKYTYEDSEQKYNNIMSTSQGRVSLGTFFYVLQQHGIDTSMPKGRPKKDESEKEQNSTNKIQRALDYLKENYEFRFNKWTSRTEIKNGDEWTNVDDFNSSDIYIELKLAGINISNADLRILLVSETLAPRYNAVQDWLYSAATWTPSEGDDFEKEIFKDDPIREFFSHIVVVDKENQEFYIHFMRKWFVGLVGMMTGELDEHNLMMVLTGAQHLGKTYFVRHILPPQLRKYLYQANPAAHIDKDFIITLSEFPLVFLDELNIGNNVRSNAYKYIISSSTNNERDAYAHFREPRPRRAALVAATNNKQYIHDREGDRRYLSVEVETTVNLNDHPLCYERAYAMALYLLRNGYNPKPSKKESDMLSAHNEKFMEPNDIEEILKAIFDKPTTVDGSVAYTAGEILNLLKNRGLHIDGLNTCNIGKAMTLLNYPSKTVHGYTKYVVAEIDWKLKQTRNKIDGQQIMTELLTNSSIGGEA